MGYISVLVKCDAELSEVLQVILSEVGFDTFLEKENGFEASIDEALFQEEAFLESIDFFKDKISYEISKVEKQNWNKLWEENYEPIEVTKDLLIRASFHQPDKAYKYEIIITPKMSFGTGHHSTTMLMLQNQLEIDHKGKAVADLGCGTGILGVMAHKLGASTIDACDIEDWSVENALENASLNNVNLLATVGTVSDMPKKDEYGIVLANINRNVLLEEMPIYASLLGQGGYLLLSGFYTKDLTKIKESAEQQGLTYQNHKEMNDWVSAVFLK